MFKPNKNKKDRSTKKRIIHNYTNSRRGFGHDLSYTPKDNGNKLDAVGWGKGIEKGHFLIISNPDHYNHSTCYLVEEIEYYREPNDMWKAQLVFYPRNPEEQKYDLENYSIQLNKSPVG